MTSWGTGAWGTGGWGYSLPFPIATGALGANSPTIIQRVPVPNDLNVPESAVVTVVFFDADGDLDPSTINISVDGVLVYNGSSFTAEFAGGVQTLAGRTVVQFVKLSGWGFDTQVQISASAQDALSNSVSDTWSWRTRADLVCYAGVTPLPIEQRLVTPLVRFLDLDVIRKTLLDYALTTRNVTNPDLRAARVVYQLGFDTEINTILNPYNLRDEVALASIVCERRASIEIDRALTSVKGRLKAGFQSLKLSGVLPSEYINAFQDYLDSVQYAYRVSLAANLVLLAHSVEANDD